ncbi:MAG: hypothetical protein EBZ77_04155, partial [Chitinophagia bacterium]|nr:hypothetical protein [Chitinophagia bacterium]
SGVLFGQKQLGGVASPVWVLAQGNTNAAVLGGEGLWRWRLHEFKNYHNHDIIDECIRQTIAFLLAGNRDRPFEAAPARRVWKDNEPISMRAFLLNANREPINTSDATVTIADSAGKKQSFTFEKSGTGYFLNLGIWAGGAYTYTATTNFDGKTYTSAGSFMVETTPAEMLGQGADYPMLFGLAKKYNGAFFTALHQHALYDSIAHNNNIKPLIQQTVDVIPLVDNKWFFALIALLLFTEWLMRKYWLAV